MPAKESKQAVLYAAKSTEDTRGSIPTQLEDGRRMAEREGWSVAGEYTDEAASAWSGDRGPQLAAAMEHAERIAPAILLVQHSDRLARGDGRSARHLGEIYFWALKSDIELRSVQDDSTFTNPLLAFAMGERNAEDSRRKSLAVRAGMKRRREAGKPHGGPRPYGYRYDGDSLVLVPHEAEIVRRVFAEFVAGHSQLAITRGLAADKVPTLRGGKWHQGTVRYLLANPVYAGFVGEARGQHEPIIDSDTWQKATALRESRARTHRRGRPPAGQHLFRKGMLRCECGESLVPRTNANRQAAPYEVYRCYGRHRDKESCSMLPLPRAKIDLAVYRYFEQVGIDVEATRQQLSEARDRKLAEVRAIRHEADTELQRASQRLARVRRDYQDGKLDADEWQSHRDELTAEKQAAEAEAKRLRESEARIAKDVALGDAEQEVLERLTEIRRAITGEVRDADGIAAVRAALGRLFEGFIVHRSTPDRVHVELMGEVWIEPIVREQAIDGYSESMRPILAREPLSQAENNYAVGLASHQLFGPIPVEAP